GSLADGKSRAGPSERGPADCHRGAKAVISLGDMSELPDAFDPEECARYLRELAALSSPILPIGEAALALASYERPRVGLLRYRQHLATIARDVGRHSGAGGDLAARV